MVDRPANPSGTGTGKILVGTPGDVTLAARIETETANTANCVIIVAVPGELPAPMPAAPAAGGSFAGTAPGAGQIALLAVTGSPTPADVISDLTAAGCTPESLAIIVDSVFNIYIPAPRRR